MDAACGTGTLSHLMNRIAPIIGFDGSPAMVSVAQKRHASITFCVGNLTRFKLPGDRKADMLVCAFDSLNYLPRAALLRKTFLNFWDNLAEGGYLLFDMNGETAFAHDGKYSRNRKVFYVGKDTIIWDNYFYPKKWKAIFEIRKNEKDGKRKTYREIHEERYYPPKAVAAMLRGVGFSIKGIYSNVNLAPRRPISARYFFVGQKTVLPQTKTRRGATAITDAPHRD